MKVSYLAVFAGAAALLGAAAAPPPKSVTFNKDVAPIFYKRCAECHRPGEVAPMSLLTYKDARPWAAAIREKVVEREMPPWLADVKYGHFANDRRMPQAEIDLISAWAKNGAPEGNPKDLPPAPKFENGWMIGKPDLTASIGEDFAVPANGVVPYKHFIVPTNFTEDRWVQAAEIRPSNRAVVHHVIVYVREPDGSGNPGPAIVRDSRDPLLVGFAPGEQPAVFAPGTAKLIKAGSSFIFQVHYTPNGKPATDRTEVGLIFAKQPVEHHLITSKALNFGFVIPAGADNHEVKSSWTAKEDVHVNDFMPHMHLRGKDFTYTVVYPDGRSEVVLSVPKYDFNWQLVYHLKEPIALPKGGRIDCVAHFDNSTNNRFNPDPTKDVKWGPQTWEEMMIGWFDITLDHENPSLQTSAVVKPLVIQ